MGPALLDLFCGAGGAAMGYARAGFNVTGVDIRHQPRYPFRFIQADALEYATAHGQRYHAIHASPPCKTHTALRPMSDPGHLSLVAATRLALERTRLPWVIENVPGAPLIEPRILCGTQFALGAWCADGRWRYLKRHRLFESNWRGVALPHPCPRPAPAIGVYGKGGHGSLKRIWTANLAEARAALGCDWMTTRELSQAIPPAYTQHIGADLMSVVR